MDDDVRACHAVLDPGLQSVRDDVAFSHREVARDNQVQVHKPYPAGPPRADPVVAAHVARQLPDGLLDGLHVPRIQGAIDQSAEGRAPDAQAFTHDESSDGHSDERVYECQAREEDHRKRYGRACGVQDICAEVVGVRRERDGALSVGDPEHVPDDEHLDNGDGGNDQDAERDVIERMPGKEIGDALVEDVAGAADDEERLRRAAEVLHFAVPEGVRPVRRPPGQPDADQGHDGGREV